MSLLQKRKLNDLNRISNTQNQSNSINNEHILYCLSMVSVVNITFGNALFENYFEGVKAVIGTKRAEQIFNQLKQRMEKQKGINSNREDEDEEKDMNMSILKQVHQIFGNKIDQEIQIRVKLFQQCIDSCMQLAQIPEAAIELINILRGCSDNTDTSKNALTIKGRELIQTIRQFIGEEQFIQLIQHSLRKLNIAHGFSTSSSSFSSSPTSPTIAKYRSGDICEEMITTSSTLSDENSQIKASQTETIQGETSKLPQMLKLTILARIIPCLSKFQENIAHIKTFTSSIA